MLSQRMISEIEERMSKEVDFDSDLRYDSRGKALRILDQN